MKEFKFYLDEKVTVWNRTEYSIPANSKKEAEDLIIKALNDPDRIVDIGNEELCLDDCRLSDETMYDTMDEMTVEENGDSTKELYDDKLKFITNNIPPRGQIRF